MESTARGPFRRVSSVIYETESCALALNSQLLVSCLLASCKTLEIRQEAKKAGSQGLLHHGEEQRERLGGKPGDTQNGKATMISSARDRTDG